MKKTLEIPIMKAYEGKGKTVATLKLTQDMSNGVRRPIKLFVIDAETTKEEWLGFISPRDLWELRIFSVVRQIATSEAEIIEEKKIQ